MVVEWFPSVIRSSISWISTLQIPVNAFQAWWSRMTSSSVAAVRMTNWQGSAAANAGMFPGASKVGSVKSRN